MTELTSTGARDDRRIRQAGGVTSERVANEGILYNEGTGQVHVLNDPARMMWELCATGPRISELSSALASAFSISPEAAEADVRELIQELDGLGVVRIEGPEGRPD